MRIHLLGAASALKGIEQIETGRYSEEKVSECIKKIFSDEITTPACISNHKAKKNSNDKSSKYIIEIEDKGLIKNTYSLSNLVIFLRGACKGCKIDELNQYITIQSVYHACLFNEQEYINNLPNKNNEQLASLYKIEYALEHYNQYLNKALSGIWYITLDPIISKNFSHLINGKIAGQAINKYFDILYCKLEQDKDYDTMLCLMHNKLPDNVIQAYITREELKKWCRSDLKLNTCVSLFNIDTKAKTEHILPSLLYAILGGPNTSSKLTLTPEELNIIGEEQSWIIYDRARAPLMS